MEERSAFLKRVGDMLILPPLPGAERGDNLGDNGTNQASPYGHECVSTAKQWGGGRLGVWRGETGSKEDNKSVVREGLRPLSLFCRPK